MKETGCGAIKLEGGRRMAETIRFLVERGVPVMAHVGLTPQSINTIGGFRAQGRDEADWAPIEDDARAVADAGAFSVVIEAVAEPLARKITAEVPIPTIGIGASAGLRRPDPGAGGHARPVAAGAEIRQALRRPRARRSRRRWQDYAAEVRARAFPGPEHVYPMKNKRPKSGGPAGSLGHRRRPLGTVALVFALALPHR